MKYNILSPTSMLLEFASTKKRKKLLTNILNQRGSGLELYNSFEITSTSVLKFLSTESSPFISLKVHLFETSKLLTW